MPDEEIEQGTHGYYFFDLDGSWRFLTPYRAEFRNAISSEIPSGERFFDWKYKVWVISSERFEDAMDIASRYFSMTQLYSVGVGQKRDLRMMDRLTELQTALRQSEQRLNRANEKVKDLEVEILALQKSRARASAARVATHSKDQCLAAVKKHYPRESAFHILPDAPNAVLRAAYRALSLEAHPDKHPTRQAAAEEDQKKINLNFEHLKKARGM